MQRPALTRRNCHLRPRETFSAVNSSLISFRLYFPFDFIMVHFHGLDLFYFRSSNADKPFCNSVFKTAAARKRLYEINRAMPNAAAAASPPINAVCNPLRHIEQPVNRPLTPPNISSASSVTAQETFKA